MAELNVNPADLLRFADAYSDLATRAAQISPQAAAEVQRIAASHGPMGYPAAVGIVTGLVSAEGPLQAKVDAFGTHAQRLTEHAATYTATDQENGQRMQSAGSSADPARTSGSKTPAPATMVSWKPGDQRHEPYIAPKDRKGPPRTPWTGDAPQWIEVGPDSGIFVRADEVPGAVIKQPGEPGPPGGLTPRGDQWGYIELRPHSGVWVPDTNFPDARFPPPGQFGPPGFREYLPGSGIWVWRDNMIPEPLAPPNPNRTGY